MPHYIARRVYREHHGPPPYPCDFCDKQVTVMGHKGVIHHRDENKDNDAIENLGAAHKGCHNVHHKIGQDHPPEVLEQLRLLHLGAKRSPETRQRISDALKGKPGTPHTTQTKSKISQKQTENWKTREKSWNRDDQGRFT